MSVPLSREVVDLTIDPSTSVEEDFVFGVDVLSRLPNLGVSAMNEMGDGVQVVPRLPSLREAAMDETGDVPVVPTLPNLREAFMDGTGNSFLPTPQRSRWLQGNRREVRRALTPFPGLPRRVSEAYGGTVPPNSSPNQGYLDCSVTHNFSSLCNGACRNGAEK